MNAFFKSQVRKVVSDRQCGAIEVARSHAIDTEVYSTKSASFFSDWIADHESFQDDLLVSFYTKLFVGRLLKVAKERLFNFHPSILPAFPGMDGFGDSIAAGVGFIGATVHLVDTGLDSGFPLIQSARPLDRNLTVPENRHFVFLHQCKMLLQIAKWHTENRIIFCSDGRPMILGAQYAVGEFSPNLDFADAISLH